MTKTHPSQELSPVGEPPPQQHVHHGRCPGEDHPDEDVDEGGDGGLALGPGPDIEEHVEGHSAQHQDGREHCQGDAGKEKLKGFVRYISYIRSKIGHV